MASRKLFGRLFVAVVVFGLALAVAADVPTPDGTGSDSGYPENDVNSQNGAAEANDGRFAARWSTRGGGAGGFRIETESMHEEKSWLMSESELRLPACAG